MSERIQKSRADASKVNKSAQVEAKESDRMADNAARRQERARNKQDQVERTAEWLAESAAISQMIDEVLADNEIHTEEEALDMVNGYRQVGGQ